MATLVTGRMVQDGTVSTNDLQLGAVTADRLAPNAAIPAGAIMAFAMSTAPAGWLPCDGVAVSRTVFSALFSAIGTTYGVGDNSTTFNVPNLQGQFVRGWTSNQSTESQDPSSATRVIGSTQGDAIRNISGVIGSVIVWIGASGVFRNQTTRATTTGGGGLGTRDVDMDASRQVPTASENRPVNIALLYCIKT